ncbi:PrsW family intramembrane metalloprotease [Halobacteriales archaeon QS_1_68_20]|nr:MAG: PrsW family intramembrane metalloprotease [Halobacteriales archaeon QS_1_68_20]
MNPSTVLRIARWEVLKGAGALDRRRIVAGVLALVVAGAIGGAVAGGDVTHDAGLYRVGVSPDTPFHGPVSDDPTFVVEEPDRAAFESGDLDLLISGGTIHVRNDRKGRAALAELRTTVLRYNDRTLAGEPNQSAAFPVEVNLVYETRDGETTADVGGGGGDSSSGGDDGGPADGGQSGDTTAPGGTGGDSSGGTGDSSLPNVGGQPLFSSGQSGSPGDIQPPFPFGALVLAFLFVVPMNFVVQAYGASVLRERIDRRGELLLVSPASPGEIVAGKTLPYFAVMIAIAVATAVWVGGGPLSIAAVVPIALVFLASTFVAAMFARSYKELTFLTVTISVGLTAFLFVPAVFTEVTPIALISPLSVVVRDLLGEAVAPGAYLFATLPLYLSAVVLFLLGVGVYREEDMFTQRPVHLKALDAFASRIRSAKGVAAVTAALIPFVFVGELLLIALLYALPLEVTIPLLLVAIAAVEELAKSVHVYAGYVHERFQRSAGAAVAVGAASGLGFFLGEKLTAIARLVQLPELPLGEAAFTTVSGPGDAGLAVLLLFAPLALHVVTAGTTAVGASRGARRYLATYLAAVALHATYNLVVVSLVA